MNFRMKILPLHDFSCKKSHKKYFFVTTINVIFFMRVIFMSKFSA